MMRVPGRYGCCWSGICAEKSYTDTHKNRRQVLDNAHPERIYDGLPVVGIDLKLAWQQFVDFNLVARCEQLSMLSTTASTG